jgi:DNA invertase Pin-like site-specific DNA recombinase
VTSVFAYLRVSTQRQGFDGLGIEAQREAVRTYCRFVGAEIAGEFVEVESGRNDDRPALSEALGACRKSGAKLVIAKLDRLSRRVSFISKFMESGVDFVACDMPHADRFRLHIEAAIAEEEAAKISARTKAALAAAKARGPAW